MDDFINESLKDSLADLEPPRISKHVSPDSKVLPVVFNFQTSFQTFLDY